MQNLLIYNDDMQVIFSRDFARENFVGTGIWTRDVDTKS